jgi:hypothetical protein
MNATVKFLADEKAAEGMPAGILVSGSAIRDQGGTKVVFIAYQGKAVARTVSIAAARAGGFLVTGLTGGEDIITAGPPGLKNGDPIRIKGQP